MTELEAECKALKDIARFHRFVYNTDRNGIVPFYCSDPLMANVKGKNVYYAPNGWNVHLDYKVCLGEASRLKRKGVWRGLIEENMCSIPHPVDGRVCIDTQQEKGSIIYLERAG